MTPAPSEAQCLIYRYSGTSSWFNAISFSDSRHGYIVGDDGSVRQTTDGGENWRNRDFKFSSPLYGVAYPDSNTVTVVGYSAEEGSGLIYRSNNNGLNWSRQTSGTSEILTGAAFLNRDTGFVVGTAGTILFTTNGGSNWRPRVSGTTIDLTGIALLNPKVAIAVGGGSIFRSTNTGASWTRLDTAFGRALRAICFSDSSVGYVVGTNGLIAKSTDAGLTWKDLSINSEYLFYAVSFASPERGTAVGLSNGSGIIASTTDGGSHWQRIPVPNLALFGVAVHDSTLGTAVGLNGGIIHQFESCSQAGWFVPELPLNGSTHEPLTTSLSAVRAVTLQWNLLPDISLKGTMVQLSTDSTFVTDLVVNTLVTLKASLITRRLTVSELRPGTKYFWRVTLLYGDGTTTAWSEVRRFTTANCKITGDVFEDANRDGIWNGGERSLAGWQVDLLGGIKNSTLTDAFGKFQFIGVDSGSYTVNAGLPLVWSRTVPSDTVYRITLAGGDSVGGLRFGNYFPWNTAEGSVFDDLNENGLQDNGEPGLAQWRVRVEGTSDDSVLTDNSGKFLFPHLTLGSVSFTSVPLASWEQINPQLGGGYTLIFNTYDQHAVGRNFAIHKIPPRVKLTLYVRDSTSFAHRNIWFGVRPGAARGIWGVDSSASNVDYSEGEFDLPPQTPGFFDARFEDPAPGTLAFGYGSWTDMRPYGSPAQVDTFRVTFSPAYAYGGGYPMTLQWTAAAVDSSYDGLVQMMDGHGGVVNMKLKEDLLLTDSSITSVTIIAHGPHLPVAGIGDTLPGVPAAFALQQNFPNPFNPATVIGYRVPGDAGKHLLHVQLVVYNLLGQTVAVLVDEMQTPGNKEVRWDAVNVPSGIYFYRLTADAYSSVKKAVLIR